jgi:hypothetical protein
MIHPLVKVINLGHSEPAPTSAPFTGCPLLLSCGWTSIELTSGFTLVTNFVGNRSHNIESLKAMSLTLHTFFELKSLGYSPITIEFMNCFLTKFNMIFYLSFLLFVIHWDILNNCKVWIKSTMVMFSVSYRPVTSRTHLDWALEWQNV